MKRYVVGLLLTATLVGCSHAAPSSPPSGAAADVQVCSHVDPAPHLLAPGGDWNTLAVAAIAYRASPYVRDAYSTAAEAQIPFQATPDQMQAVMAKWNHLSDVCAQVRANETPGG